MKRYLLIVAATIAFFLMLFFAVEALGVSLLQDPTPWMQQGGILAGILGVSLLVADVLLPVPSSLMMVAHGALFGVVKGTFLSLLGSLGAALVGFAIGRRGGKLLDRLVTKAERVRADQLLARWGALAIAVTRPVPLLAETVAIMAGASPLGWGRLALAAVVGSLPPSLIYALTGATVVNFQSTALMFGAVLLVTGSFWLAGRLLDSILSNRRNRRDAEQPEANSSLKLVRD
ncbi:MAG TPA: VTT domain-containing protein [Pyrinomonadaceae bacterium]|nr:VTT domain-containing protein [Pyrinomonadaceae bacterium]